MQSGPPEKPTLDPLASGVFPSLPPKPSQGQAIVKLAALIVGATASAIVLILGEMIKMERNSLLGMAGVAFPTVTALADNYLTNRLTVHSVDQKLEKAKAGLVNRSKRAAREVIEEERSSIVAEAVQTSADQLAQVTVDKVLVEQNNFLRLSLEESKLREQEANHRIEEHKTDNRLLRDQNTELTATALKAVQEKEAALAQRDAANDRADKLELRFNELVTKVDAMQTEITALKTERVIYLDIFRAMGINAPVVPPHVTP